MTMRSTMARLTRVWDLRRGDADDDRSSPHGRGWASIIFASALEFNYLTAPITFLSLVAGPALILGLVPPIVATYGHRAFLASIAGAHPRLAIPIALILVATALVIARPVLSLGMESMWQLKYTLIFPLFVGVRELLCFGLERLTGRLEAPEQFARVRRLGTAVAALLFASGALLLAAAIEFSSGGRLVAAFDARLWGIALAGLRNAVVIVSFGTAFVAIQWLWREVMASRPVRAWVPPEPSPDAKMLHIAHLSDLHLVAGRFGFRMESGTKGPRGNGRFHRALCQLEDLHAVTPLDRVLVSGDITDAGTRAEWIEFAQILRDCPELRARMLFVPGNHDVNVVDATNPGRLDLPGSMGQALRRLRVVLALDELQGTSVHIVDRRSRALGPTLSEYLRTGSREEVLRELADRGTRRGRREVARVWNTIFPLVAPPPERGGYGVLLLDSNARRHLSLTNAIGVVGRSQLTAIRQILRSSRDRSWLIVLHHHVVEYPDPTIGLTERIGLSLANAPDVLDAISKHRARVLVLHGHRHRDWIGARDGITLCSAPSVMLGSYNIDRHHGYFHIYELAPTSDGGVQLSRSRVIAVA
jgi:predicted phosphodiesterase